MRSFRHGLVSSFPLKASKALSLRAMHRLLEEMSFLDRPLVHQQYLRRIHRDKKSGQQGRKRR